MKTTLKWLLLGLFLVALMATSTPRVAAQTPVTLQVYDPTGAYEVTQLHAPRVADLNGRVLCEVSSYNWEWDRTFPVIRDLLQKQYPTIKIVPWDKLGVNSRAEEENHEHLTKMVK